MSRLLASLNSLSIHTLCKVTLDEELGLDFSAF